MLGIHSQGTGTSTTSPEFISSGEDGMTEVSGVVGEESLPFLLMVRRRATLKAYGSFTMDIGAGYGRREDGSS